QTGHAYLVGQFNAQQINLETAYWSDSEIDARVDPKTSGELDQDNVSLVITPAGAAQIKASGFKFVAARSDPAVFLPSIPQAWWSHSGWSSTWGAPVRRYFSPVTPGGYVPQDA